MTTSLLTTLYQQHKKLLCITLYISFFSIAFSGNAIAETGLPALTITNTDTGGQTWSLSLQVLLLMTMITLLPAIVLAMTAFTRITIVLALLRQALGTGQTPSNQVLIGIALFLTLFVMSPVLDQSWQQGVAPYLDGQMAIDQAWPLAFAPFRDFMLANVRENDLLLFSQIAGLEKFASPSDVPFSVLVPAFLTSELRTSFEIGFMLFIPFVVIDLVIASILMSMGMMMMSPMLISAPFKILLFVLVDGWVLVIGSLSKSFQGLSP